MSIVDARTLEPDAELRAEICVVGAGAAGITLALKLADAGRDVCLVESGGFRPDDETQHLYDLKVVGHPVRERFMSRARYYGGSCNLWAGRSMRLEASDLIPPECTPAAAWPVSYAELAAYYPPAATLLRLPGVDHFDRERYAGAMSAQERRLFSLEPLLPTVSLWAKRPMRFGKAFRSRLRRSPRIRLVLHANVTAVTLNGEGTSVDSLAAATLDGRRLVLRASDYVLACGGLENARLLLASRDTHVVGVGNGHDLVGRYFMDHPRAVFGRVRLFPETRLSLLGGHPLRAGMVQLGIGLTPQVREHEGWLNHYATLEPEVSGYTEATYQSFVRTMKVLLRRGSTGHRWQLARGRLGHIQGMIYLLTPKEIVPHLAYRWYTAVREAVAPRAGGRRVVVYFCEQPARAESRVTLSPERDRLNVNKLILDWRIPPEVTRDVLRLQEVLRRCLKAAGIGELDHPEGAPAFTDASHHMGTTRMGASPRTGVVDADCRVHGVRNLFMAGSSVFPSAGHANPTLTVVALALRLADRLRVRGRP